MINKKWYDALDQARGVPDQEDSMFIVSIALDDANRELEVARKKQDTYDELMDKAEEACIYQGNFEAVCDLIDAANIVKDEIHMKEEAALKKTHAGERDTLIEAIRVFKVTLLKAIREPLLMGCKVLNTMIENLERSTK